MGRKHMINGHYNDRRSNKNTIRTMATSVSATKELDDKESIDFDDLDATTFDSTANYYVIGAILILSIGLYFNALDCGFVFDDMSAIKDNKDLRSNVPITQLFLNDFWGTPMANERSHKSYRPLTVLTFRLNYAIGELSPWGYHLVNILLHSIVAVQFYNYCLSLGASSRTAAMSSLLFAVHPVHTEAVTGVVGRAELLASVFFLGALSLYRRCCRLDSMRPAHWLRLCVVIFLVALGTLCKEQCITVVGVCCVYEVLVVHKFTLNKIWHLINLIRLARGRRPNAPNASPMSRTHIGQAVIVLAQLRLTFYRCIFLVGATCGLLYLRIQVMGAQLPVFTAFDNPAAHAPTPLRQLTYNYLLPVNLWLLLVPHHLCCDWTMGTLPVITGFSDPRNLVTLVFWIAFIFISFYVVTTKSNYARIVGMAMALLALPFLPATNLFFPVGFVVAERVLYTPSMGFCLFLGSVLDRALQRTFLRHGLTFFFTAVLLLMSLKTWQRNYDWRDEYSLFTSALRVNVRNAKIWNNVGHALESKERWSEALSYFEEAVRVQPDDIGAHLNVGRTLLTLNRSVDAESAFRSALSLLPQPRKGQAYTTRVAPQHLKVFINLANLLVKRSHSMPTSEKRLQLLNEADSLLHRAISMRADFTEAYQNRADVLIRLGRKREAMEHYHTALGYSPNNPDLLFNLGVVKLGDGDKSSALSWFERALSSQPDHQQALYNSAILLTESSDPQHKREASSRLQKLLPSSFEKASVLFNLGMLATDRKDFLQAEQFYMRSLQIEPGMRAALFNLALMYNNELNKPLSALPHLQTILQLYPDHAKAHLLIGDVYLNAVKNAASARHHFQRAVDLQPDNAQAVHNLCVAQVEQGELEAAEKCLRHAITLAPNEKYIRDHLEVVVRRIKLQKTAP